MAKENPTNGDPARITWRGQALVVERGTTVRALMDAHPHPDDGQVIAAVVNNRLVSLSAPIVRSGTVAPVTLCCEMGGRLYQRHLTLMLYEVVHRLFPGVSMQIGQAISEGHYFHVSGVAVDEAFLSRISAELAALAAAREPFVLSRVTVEEARRIFRKKGEKEKRLLLKQWPFSHVELVRIRDYMDLCLSPVAPHTGYFDRFALLPLETDAFILQFPHLSARSRGRNETHQPKLYQTHKEAREWSRLVGISHVAELNQAAISGEIREVIKVAEALHEKKISQIADQIAGAPGRRLVFISGPSSAGKTTFAKRLSIQLRVAGLAPVAISLDNYYVNRADTPMGENGLPDYEALEAIDLARFNSDLRRIVNGEEVRTPQYNFTTGERDPEDRWIPVRLGDRGVAVIEGIHGLNDALTPAISAQEKFRIYINALNPLAIDSQNRLNTSDVRLIRRIVRDRHYRNYSAARTINQWPEVRHGERLHIFPFQESADVIFDTSLIYEFSVLKIWAERYLMEVPRQDPAYATAYRLKKFLGMFVTVLPGDVPNTSLMREFIGGSSFSYRN
mgnify:CR=1 FL=1